MHTNRLSQTEIAMAASLLTAMGNRKRMLILDIISRNETSVGKLAQMVGMGQSALSQHLTILKNVELVQTRREAQTIYYRSESEKVTMMLAALYEIFDIPEPKPAEVDVVGLPLASG